MDQFLEASGLEKVMSLEWETVWTALERETAIFTSALLGFVHAVRWSEPLIIAILSFHVLTLFITFLLRRHIFPLSIFWIFILALIWIAENLNRFGSANWQSFSTQNYFDKQGVFMAVVFCGPLLLISLIIVIIFTIHAGKTLIVAKAEQFRRERARRDKAQSGEGKKEK